MQNFGYLNEKQIVNVLNDKLFVDLNEHWKEIIKIIFPKVKENDIVKCEQCDGFIKPDIIIQVNNVKKNISIKSGHHVSVHCETVSQFCGWLAWAGLPQKQVDFLKLYHYGDGTLDGTGDFRYGYDDLKIMYAAEIQEFNSYFQNKELIYRVLNRFLSLGTNAQTNHVDYFYYGNCNDGYLVSKEDLFKYMIQKRYRKMECIHFADFSYTAMSRDLRKKVEENKKRYYCSIKWNYGEDTCALLALNKH